MRKRPRVNRRAERRDEVEDGILDLQHLDRPAELEHKRQRVVRALRARGSNLDVPPPLPSPKRRGARARVSLRITDTGLLVVRRPGTHDAVPPPMADMARSEIVAAAARLEPRLAGAPELAAALDRVELRSDGARVVAVFYGKLRKRDHASLAAVVAPALCEGDAAAFEGRGLIGQPRLRLPLGKLDLEVGPLTFFQVNLEANQDLVNAVVSSVAGFAPARVLDLFGGAGNFSLPLAASGIDVELVESHPPAVKDARANAARLGLPLSVAREDAYRLQPGSRFFDVAVLDPPRRGAGAAMAAVCTTRPRAIVLVSCHPPSLARDLEQAAAQGYRVERLTLHDLFPLTSHVESLAVLTR